MTARTDMRLGLILRFYIGRFRMIHGRFKGQEKRDDIRDARFLVTPERGHSRDLRPQYARLVNETGKPFALAPQPDIIKRVTCRLALSTQRVACQASTPIFAIEIPAADLLIALIKISGGIERFYRLRLRNRD